MAARDICDLVFEEVTAKEIGVTVDGPKGPVQGAILVQELHMDGTFEDKTFAPGYGEFFTGSGGDVEAVAVAIPEDALPGLPPKELETLATGATDVFDAAQAEWKAADATVEEMTVAWDTFKEGQVPPRPRPRWMMRWTSWGRRSKPATKARHVGDAATLELIRDRIARDVTFAELQSIDAGLSQVRAAAEARDLVQASAAAVNLRSSLIGPRRLLRIRKTK